MSQRPLAIFTIACNEPFFFPMWLRHYQHHAPEADLYVLSDRNYRGHEFDAQLSLADSVDRISDVKVQAPAAFDHDWLRNTVQAFQAFLLQTYAFVLFAEIDEFWVHPVDPLDTAIGRLNPGLGTFHAQGYDVSRPPEAPPLVGTSPQRPFLRDHERWAPSRLYSKPTLSSVPCNWVKGFHNLVTGRAHPTDLLLVHCHRYDFATALARSREIAQRAWSSAEIDARLGWQNRIADEDDMRSYFGRDIDDTSRPAPFEPIPDWVRQLV